MPKIRLINENEFENIPNQSILESGRSAGYVLEHSCRNGQCGVCKANLLDGDTNILQPEFSLAANELASGVILTCCREAIGDIRLGVEDLGAFADLKVQTLPCRINKLSYLSPDILEVTLRTPPNSKLKYLPGQYIDVIGNGGVRRSYSIANSPRSDGHLTLQIRKVSNGEFSQYWFNEARLNDLLRLEGPLGTFGLRQNEASRLIMLATGTGIAPIKAMGEQIASDKLLNVYQHVNIYWGNRVSSDIYWSPDFLKMPFTFTPVLSRDSAWKGRRGYVQQVACADIDDLSDAAVYACGSDAMIHDARAVCEAAGLPKNRFYSDAFVASGG